MTESRTLVREAVDELPGIHFNGLVRRLGLAPGQAQHHLQRLREDGAVERLSLYGRTHYFPPGIDPTRRGALAVCHRETARDVLVHLLEAGPSAPSGTAAALGVARSTLEWHLDHLLEQHLVEKRREDGNRVELQLVDPEATVELLSEIEPALPERLLDRFTRLVDSVLGD